MDMHADKGREFWREVLGAGGPTAIPRWTAKPSQGTAVFETRVPDELVGGLRGLAGVLGVRVSSLWLAAHARVLAVLSGEDEVVTGWVPVGGGRGLPCRVAAGGGRSWR
ncbi:non-ribosomal peptide synthetase, partial [Streptomyces tirandamycinicus]